VFSIGPDNEVRVKLSNATGNAEINGGGNGTEIKIENE
jgi:hypothetical protein